MTYNIIYDGNCNLCTTLVQGLETFDQGQNFQYLPMQDKAMLEELGITPGDCELGMILINADDPTQRWQGSDAAEEIGRILPGGQVLVDAYRAVPGMKWAGDRIYEQVRDHRYSLFGQRPETYRSAYPGCAKQSSSS